MNFRLGTVQVRAEVRGRKREPAAGAPSLTVATSGSSALSTDRPKGRGPLTKQVCAPAGSIPLTRCFHLVLVSHASPELKSRMELYPHVNEIQSLGGTCVAPFPKTLCL